MKDKVFIDSMIRARKLHSLCSHDLRSYLGVVKTTFSLYEDEPPYDNPQIHRLLVQAHKSVDLALSRLDSSVESLRLRSRFIWILSSEAPPEAFLSPLDSEDLIVGFRSIDDLYKELESYRPNFLVFDESLVDESNFESFILKTSPRRTNSVFVRTRSKTALSEENLLQSGIKQIIDKSDDWAKSVQSIDK